MVHNEGKGAAPWEKYYVAAPEFKRDATLYTSYVAANRDHLDELAIVSMDGGFRYTHRELLEMIDLAAAGFYQTGVRRASKVGIMLNNSVEEAVSLLALNKLGAVSFFVDVTKSPSEIRDSIAEQKLDLLIIDEIMLPMEEYVNPEGYPIVIANQTKPHAKGMPFLKLYALGRDVCVEAAPYEEGRPAVIINSSGTTGRPKPIVHSDRSVNSAAYKMLRTDYSLTRENLVMKIIPSSIGLGLITTLYTALLSGTKIVLISGNNPQQSILNTVVFASNFPLFREGVGLNPNAKLLIFTAPMYYRIMVEKLDIFEDMSYIGAMLAAGSKMGRAELDEMNRKMAEKNCPVAICNGYGQNEMCGAVTLNSNAANKNGSAGFPVDGTRLRVVDPETLEPLPENEIGLILEQSDSQFLYYENLPQETADATLRLADGSVWFNTKDLGRMDGDGFVYITGRMSRVLVRFDFKIPIDKIEEKIKAHPRVLDCAVIAERKNDIEEVPIAYVSLRDGGKGDLRSVFDDIQASREPLSDMEYPERATLLEQLPYMKNGKIDYLALQKLNEGASE